MNGFENIDKRVKLRTRFQNETGCNSENSQGEPDVDYVLWLESELIKNEPTLPDESFDEALSTILRVAVAMVSNGMSGDLSEWDLPKSTPMKVKRKIVNEADKWHDVNVSRAVELKQAYDLLKISKH